MEYCDVKSQLSRYIQARSEEAFTRGEATRDALQSITALETYRTDVRERFIAAMGGLPESTAELNAQVTGRVDADGYQVENVVFTPRSGIYVTANLWLPNERKTPGGAVLFLCGHDATSKLYPDYQAVCLQLVSAGLIVLAMDPTGQGERQSYPEPVGRDQSTNHPVWEHSYIGCRCLPLGQSLIRYFVHDAMCAIDYLCTRPEVDSACIGVTGSSGGGTQTCALMLTESRLAAAAPVNFLMNRRSYLYTGGAQDAEQIWRGFTANGFDHEDFLAAMAPRPVLVGASDSDFFPIEGTRASVARSTHFWQLYEAEDRLQLLVDQAPHRYTEKHARAVAAFFAHHLNGMTVDQNLALPSPPDIAALRVTKTGQVMTTFADACSAHDANIQCSDELAAHRKSFNDAALRDRALTWLRQVVTGPRQPCEPNPRCIFSGKYQELSAAKYLWWSQPGLMNHALRFQDRSLPTPTEGCPVTLAVWDGGTTAVESHLDWIRKTCAQGRNVWVLDVSGMGELEPNPINAHPMRGLYGTIYRLADDLIWLDDSLVALRVHDVLRAVDVISSLDDCASTDFHAYSSDRHGLYVHLATALEPRVQQVELEGRLKSFDDWIRPHVYDDHKVKEFILPDVLEYFDLPDLDRWLGARMIH